MLETFGNASGLSLNDKKTDTFWIGSMSNGKVVLSPEKNLKWPEQKVKALGGLVFKPPTDIFIIESSRKIGNGKKDLELVESPKVKSNRENRCFKSLVASQPVYFLTSLQSKEPFR